MQNKDHERVPRGRIEVKGESQKRTGGQDLEWLQQDMQRLQRKKNQKVSTLSQEAQER